MDLFLEELGLAPDLSRLSLETQTLIRHGSRNDSLSHSKTFAAVCVEMLRAGYDLAEIWLAVTDHAHSTSKILVEQEGERAEDYLEELILRAHEEAFQSRSNDA